MEKVIYLLSALPGGAADALSAGPRAGLGERLRALGADAVTINVADEAVAPASGLRMAMSSTPAEALVSVWVDSAVDHLRRGFDEAVASLRGVVAAYLVTESVPLRSDGPRAADGRVDGMAQVAFLQRPEGQPVDEWFDIWLNSHTPVAIDTQDTFSYVQNVVTRVLTPGAEPWHAIVEECFPPGAMTDPHVFYDAVGDDAKLAERQQVMFDSVRRFIDLSRIDVLPTSRYDV